MDEMVFVGYSYGRFTDSNTGAIKDYCNVFVLEQFVGTVSNDYNFDGVKAVKYGCTSPDVFKNVPINSKIRCYFDSRKKISYIEVVA